MRIARSSPFQAKRTGLRHENAHIGTDKTKTRIAAQVASVLTAAHRRHHHGAAPAGSAIDLLAGAKLEILGHADTNLA